MDFSDSELISNLDSKCENILEIIHYVYISFYINASDLVNIYV